MKYNDENHLEMIELYAAEMGYIDNEEALSEMFDDQVMPELLAAHGKPGIEFDDQDMINQCFNDWTDGLCKDGEIHPLQYNQYCYVGEHSD